jgi:hypothetical protein
MKKRSKSKNKCAVELGRLGGIATARKRGRVTKAQPKKTRKKQAIGSQLNLFGF